VRRSLLALAVVAACAGCGGSGSGLERPSSSVRGSELNPPLVAPGFSLHDQNGRTVTLAQQRGDWVIVTFLYTHCPDVCPIIAGKLNAALRTPAAKRARLRVIAVSVDPRRDTPAAVAEYVKVRSLLPTFHYLIGSHAQLARVWHAYHIAVLPSANDTTVTHQAIEFLIDPQGRERLIYDRTNLGNLTADVVHDLGQLKAE
jgi:protein SCO1/2